MRVGKRYVHQGDDDPAGVRDAPLKTVDADVRAQERDVVRDVQNHPYVGMERVERGIVVTWTSIPTTIVIWLSQSNIIGYLMIILVQTYIFIDCIALWNKIYSI